MQWATARQARGSTGEPGFAVPQARAGSECLRVLGVQALASPHSGRFADVSLDTTRSHRASFRFLAHAGPLGVWQLRCDASEARVAPQPSLRACCGSRRLRPAVLPVDLVPRCRKHVLAPSVSGHLGFRPWPAHILDDSPMCRRHYAFAPRLPFGYLHTQGHWECGN